MAAGSGQARPLKFKSTRQKLLFCPHFNITVTVRQQASSISSYMCIIAAEAFIYCSILSRALHPVHFICTVNLIASSPSLHPTTKSRAQAHVPPVDTTLSILLGETDIA
jgi:hypothetical protein